LLLAVSIPAPLPAVKTVQFEISSASSVAWSPGPNSSSFPIQSARAASPTPLSGTITIANGNPGGAFDLADLGEAFDIIESVGLAGPVVLELYDDGGPFISSTSYQLGANAATTVVIPGLNATNTITIRRGPGESPVITGSGAVSAAASTSTGTLCFNFIGFWNVDGIEISGGINFGIHSYTSVAVSDVSIRNCKIHDISVGGAIFFYGNAGATNNVAIENNMVWNCFGDGGTLYASGMKGVIGARRIGTGWVIRHNTIVHAPSSVGSSVFFNNGNTVPFADLSYNVVHLTAAAGVPYFRMDSATGTFLPTVADRNVIFLAGGANMCNNLTFGDFTQWQASGRVCH
jgi:hypothetical protein